MTISAVSSAATPTTTKSPAQTLGQRDFIRLMTTQMKLQDPTDPVDNKEMIAQMAQFSSLSGIENVNSTLKAISAQLDQVLAAKAATPTA
ncbi:MAG: flagellar hook assembly protein FlgD [Novosphingobium sp.]